MRFIYADSLDFVDPLYDFVADRLSARREAYWSDRYPHEMLETAPYDGLLVSRAIVGDYRNNGKYSAEQRMRFRLVGAREFLRYPETRYPGSWLLGDCGAFSYHQLPEPPYTAEEMVEFYEEGGFTHGCSVDHVIFEFDEKARDLNGGSTQARSRFEITLENARRFLQASRSLAARFTPIGVIQGWSPDSMALAAEQLQAMGYTYLAVGGMVPLKSPQIHTCLEAIRSRIRRDIGLHVLGFAKADEIHEFVRHNITSFDTTSPLLRAFKDARRNYYLPSKDGKLRYYTAIRIPQAIENNLLKNLVKAGRVKQELLLHCEARALSTLRAYDVGRAGLEETLDSVLSYAKFLLMSVDPDARDTSEQQIAKLAPLYRQTLQDKPWKECDCAICTAISVEVVIFRSSNRNKRRGIHNLSVYHKHILSLAGQNPREPETDLFSNPRETESSSPCVLLRRVSG